ncbi:conserved hypothetical protein [Hyphomicrobiales bacterium]|jgi:hypothetical protein|nr:conserved hypothetical protein [Hyphomicrobiales bacterium]CAH1702508.1 hypothetical protein BOSEA1005_30380 [Hyphomicrobiales bacterium]CAI0346709.1 conserved hypothetical protein [Hyphomicrobiales bacterium]
MLPSPSFQASVVSPNCRLYSVLQTAPHGTMDEVFGEVLEDRIADSTPLKDVTYATLFTYLHRRFGYPSRGSDPYKDLSAAWLLSTPEPDIVIHVIPSVSGNNFTFTIYTTTERSPFSPEPISRDEQLRIAGAYRSLLLDLLRPVCIQDAHINALGEVEDDELLAYDEKEGEPLYEVKYAASSGYPILPGLVGTRTWEELLGQASFFGSDRLDGLTAIVTEGRNRILAQIPNEPVDVQVLIGMYTTLSRPNAPAIEIDFAPEVPERIAALQAVLWKDARPTSEDLATVNDAAVERAETYLDALAVPDDLGKAARRVRATARLHEVYEAICDACGRDFPDEVFDEKRVLWNDDDVQRAITRMKEGGHDALAETVEGLFSTDPWPTTRCLHALQAQAFEHRKNADPGPTPG